MPTATLEATASAELETRDLTKSYGRLEALAALSLTLQAGDCMVLMGPNGCGKTTALSTIAGLLEPTSGEVLTKGLNVHHEPEAIDARARMATVPDNPVLYDDMTVREHLQLVAVAHGAGGPDLEERTDDILERLALTHRADFKPGELSRGMRQKTQLACALIRPFSVLLLDEPVVGLDSDSVEVLERTIAALRADGVALLVSTHQREFAVRISEHALEMRDGHVVNEVEL